MTTPKRRDGTHRNKWGHGSLLRDDIVAAARQILEQEGTEAAISMRGVAREAGISAPSIYPHFANREALIETVIGEIAAEFIGHVDDALATGAPESTARGRLIARMQAYISFGSTKPSSYHILFARPHPTELPAVRRVILDSYTGFLADLAEVLPGLSQEAVDRRGAILWSAVHGLTVLPVTNPRFPWPPIDELVGQLLDALLRDEGGRRST